MRHVLVAALFAALAVQPAFAQHTTGEGNPIDNSSPKLPTTQGQNGDMTITNQPLSSANPVTPAPHLDCKPEGAACKADSDCCTGGCQTAGEGRACAPK
jgi:hypothetical protein